MDEEFGQSWDLGEVLAERAQPTDSVTIYLNEKASYAKGKLLEAHSRETDKEALKLIDTELSKVEEDLEKRKYVVNITAVPSRMREDIASRALADFPIKANMFGQDDPENAMLRNRHQNDLVWAAQIVSVVNPAGAVKSDWTIEEIQKFSAALPVAVQESIDKAIRELTLASEKFTVGSKNTDF